MTRAEEITAALAKVRARIAAAEARVRRAPGSARLLAVSKKMTVDDIRAAMAAGQREFGESYAQELRDKRAEFEQLATGSDASPSWHYIGPLQMNKVKYVAGKVALIHAVDSPEVLAEVDRRADREQPCLVQVNVAGEQQKHGLAPAALPGLLDRFPDCRHARCIGLMLIPPYSDDPEACRPHFAALRALRDEERARSRPNVTLTELSMGMSHDLEVAISEGATIVRVGEAIFGARA